MGDDSARLTENLAQVRGRIRRAAERSGRDPESVKLIAVSKGQSPPAIEGLIAAGVRDFGENRVQELTLKEGVIVAGDVQPTWHMIGSLQTNKVKALLRACHIVHSVDRLALASELSRRVGELPGAVRVRVFLEVNVSGEPTKSGVAPEDAPTLLRQVASLPGLDVVGLMTMAPASSDPESSRPVFRALRVLAERLNDLDQTGTHLTELSMGMSQDFEVAVEEGATLVRVGAAIFGTRTRA